MHQFISTGDGDTQHLCHHFRIEEQRQLIDAYGRLRALLRELPLYNILLPRSDTMPSCFSSVSEYQAMWDEMMTKGTRGNNDYTHWISRICRIGADLHEFQRNTSWMLSTYFDNLTSHRREDYIDAFARFKEGIRDAFQKGELSESEYCRKLKAL